MQAERTNKKLQIQDRRIWLGALLGALAYSLYLILSSGIFYFIRGGYFDQPTFLSLEAFFLYLIFLPQAIITGGLAGLILTAILLRKIYNPIYIGLSVAFLVYILREDYINFFKFGFFGRLFLGSNYARELGNIFLYQAIVQLVIVVCIGLLIGFIIKKRRQNARN